MSEIICSVTSRRFTVPEEELEIIRRVSEVNAVLGAKLPLPMVYPTEILRQMAPFGNQLHIHRGKSAISGKPLLSRYAPETGYRSVTSEEFWSDQVDNLDSGTPYDFSKPFFQQWNELMHRCYLLPLLNDRNENCDFANGCFNCKACYLCFDTTDSEDCLYCFACHKGNSNVDCVHSESCSYCYSCSDVSNCYEGRYLRDCNNCVSSFGCLDCRSCNNCIGCAGLSNASYRVFNEQLTKEAYLAFVAEHDLFTRAGVNELLDLARPVHESHLKISNRQIQCEDCVGSYLKQSSNLLHCYNSIGSKDCSYLLGSINSRDFCKGFGYNSELGYCAVTSGSYNCHFSYSTSNCNSCWYSYYLFTNCADCFGCVGLKKNQYCILNFQLSKAEYEEQVPRIVKHMQSTGEWGHWFPVQYSTNSYQESWADQYLEEISEVEAINRGYRCAELQLSSAEPNAVNVIELREADDTRQLLGKPIRCSRTGGVFSFQTRELEFYKRFGISLPTIHWRERLKDLLGDRDRMPDVLAD